MEFLIFFFLTTIYSGLILYTTRYGIEMEVIYKNGIPIEVRGERVPCTIRVKEKPRGKKHKSNPLKFTKKQNKDLNMRQRRALSNLYQGMDKKEAGVKAGYSPKSASQSVNRAIEVAAGNDAFKEAMEKEGITYERLAKVLDEGLDAKNPFKPDQKDHKVINLFFKDAAKVLDVFPASRIQQQTEAKHIHVHLTGDDYKQVQKYKELTKNDGEQREYRQETQS